MVDLSRQVNVNRWHKQGYAGGFSSVRVSDPQLQRAIQEFDGILAKRFGNSSPLTERAITWGDLARNGLAELNIGGKIIGRQPGDDPPFANPIPVPARPEKPHQPTGLVGYGTYRSVILTWDRPNYAGHGYTEVYKSATSAFGDAVLAGRSNSRVFADRIGAPFVVTYYWIRFVNELGEAGVFTQVGLQVQTGTATEGEESEATDLLVADKGIIVEALIGDAEIGGAKIRDASIESAKIISLAANKITAGSIQLSQYIQSANYIAGTSGWRINGDGSAEFMNVEVRADIAAGSTITAPVINGGTINSSTLNSAAINAGEITGTTINGVNVFGSNFFGSIFASQDAQKWLAFDGYLGYILYTPNAKISVSGATQFSNAIGDGGVDTGLSIAADQWVQIDPGPGNTWIGA